MTRRTSLPKGTDDKGRRKVLLIIGTIMLAAVLTYRGLQFYHWWQIGFDMRSYNPYMPIVDFLAGHAFLATIIVASLPAVYYVSAIFNYMYDSTVIWGLVRWGYLTPAMAAIEIVIILFEFVVIFYIIRKFLAPRLERLFDSNRPSGYKS